MEYFNLDVFFCKNIFKILMLQMIESIREKFKILGTLVVKLISSEENVFSMLLDNSFEPYTNTTVYIVHIQVIFIVGFHRFTGILCHERPANDVVGIKQVVSSFPPLPTSCSHSYLHFFLAVVGDETSKARSILCRK